MIRPNNKLKITPIFLTIFFVLTAFEARADLVEKTTKEIVIAKNKYGKEFDPKNNLRDHCELMVQLDYKISRNTKSDPRCFEDLCSLAFGYYIFDKFEWRKERIDIIYKPSSLKIIGRVVADDIVYESYDSQKYYIEQQNYFLEKKIDGIKNEKPKNSNIHYIKTHGCKIEETNINIKNLTK